MADADWENRGPDNCERCGVACHADELTLSSAGERVCEGCDDDQRADDAWEAKNADRTCEYEPRSAFS
jgi:hypothetical protein